ncbi:MAG: hypothetical protein JJ896_14390 [Rhodothermales bacterium]|nr:hypothetical protein [Rhodothermales bacterium]MBO6780839.1 hypothetical protein [Rhodothermales bacterium]
MSDSFIASLQAVESAFRSAPPDLLEIMLEVRGLAFGVKPWAEERIRRTGITLFDPKKGGTVTGGICFVDIHNGFVRVRFGRGVFLDDPCDLLQGDQKYMRFMDLHSFDDTPWEELERLLQQSAHLDEGKVRRSHLWPRHS